MSTTQTHQDHDTRNAWAGGVSFFGGTVLATVGLFQFFEGLSAALEDKVYLSTRDYTYRLDLTTWGWIHMILGVIAIAVGVAILMNQPWGLLFGVFIAGISALSQFLFLPWQPLWALLIIGIEIAVIWALCTKLSEDRPA